MVQRKLDHAMHLAKIYSKKGRRAGISLPARIMKKIFLAIFFTLSLYPGNMKKSCCLCKRFLNEI